MGGKGARVVVVGNLKGGSGKSTTALHLVVHLLRLGRRVASLDLDLSQGSFTRYLENRRTQAARRGLGLPMPTHLGKDAVQPGRSWLPEAMERLGAEHDVIIVDTPGNDSALSRLGHSFADVLVTPLNDSLVDLDVLAMINPDTGHVERPGPYAEIVWEQKTKRAMRDGGSIDWVVLRNRLSSLDAHNKREMERLLKELSMRFGFRLAGGLAERVVYRELFLKGLTLMDVREIGDDEGGLKTSHVAGRQEVRSLAGALGI